MSESDRCRPSHWFARLLFLQISSHLRSDRHMKSFRRQLPVLSLALALVLATTSFGKPPIFDKVLQTSQQLPSLPPTQYIPDHDFDARHIALDLRFDWEHEQLNGIETFVFKPLTTNLRKIELDAAEMT